MEPITFSILIATRNRSLDLRRTLISLEPLLARADVECIICDDGSYDDTASVIAAFAVRVVRHNQSLGYIASRNELLSMARGTYAISLDDDAEFLSPNPLEAISRHFKDHEKCGAIAFRIFWGLERPPAIDTMESPRQVKNFVGCGHAWRMDSWRSIRPYPEWFGFYGEEEFASLELFRTGQQVHYLPSVLVHHRVDMKARRSSPDFALRYRRSLRSGFYLQFLFYPTGRSWRHFISSAVRQALYRIPKNAKLAQSLFMAVADVVRNSPLIRKYRIPLTPKQYRQYRALPDAVIYWHPKP